MSSLSSSTKYALLAAALSTLEQALTLWTLKSVNEVLREYRDTLTRWIVDSANGNLMAGDMSRQHKTLLKRLALAAYLEGMREGGISSPEEELDDDDRETIADWVNEQGAHTLDFARAAAAVSKLNGDEKTAARGGMWVS